MIKRITLIINVIIISLLLLTGCDKKVRSSDFTAEQLDCFDYDVEKYTTPFWEGNIVYNECVYPLMNDKNELIPFELMYYADEIVSVKDPYLQKTYVKGIDYKLKDGKLVIIPGGNILYEPQEYIHPYSNPYNYGSRYMISHKDGQGFEFCNDTGLFEHGLYVTYIHNDSWTLPIPESMSDRLRNTFKKLESGQDFNVVLTGDSISVGYNSSRIMAKPPYAEGYALMAINALRDKYDCNIKFINSAVGGSTASFTKEQLDKDILRYNPSLVIMAYGMNDGSQNVSADEYKNNINGRIKYVKENLPDCEVLLVTSYIGNPWVFDKELYMEQASKLYEIVDEWDGVGICDPQSIQLALMEEKGKEFISFMGDNLVHPNDYGMRIMAQCVITALTE